MHVYIYTAWATRDLKSPHLTKKSKFSILKHFHLKNRCSVHVYIDTAWATRDFWWATWQKIWNFSFSNIFTWEISVSACLHIYSMGNSRSEIATLDKKFKIFHFYLKNRCLLHVNIYTAWATRDLKLLLLTNNLSP